MSSFVSGVKLFCDGGCHGNLGSGAIGWLILDNQNQELCKRAVCIGDTTNNRVEYRALVAGLDECAKYTRGRVTCFMDSELVVKQMNGAWRLKNDRLRELFYEARNEEGAFEQVIYQHVKRDNPFIRKVDRLVNEALEGWG